MENASEWRVALARQIAPIYGANAQVKMVAIGGSAARGQADEYSDIDMMVYCEKADTDWLAEPPIVAEGCSRITYREVLPGVFLEQYMIGDLKIDIAHLPLDWAREVVDTVIVKYDMSGLGDEMLGGFMTAIPLYGEELYEEWRSRIADYPEGLARSVVEKHLFFYPRWVIENQGLGRDDLYSFYDHLNHMLRNMIGVLAGVNRRYVATEKVKRVGETLRGMAIAPAGAPERAEALFRMNRADVPAALDALLRETLDIVEKRMPEIDISRTRRMLDFQLVPCRERPAFEPAGVQEDRG
jgi:hypothetical protein